MPPKAARPDTNEIHFYIESKCDFKAGEDYLERRLFVPLSIDEMQRQITSKNEQIGIGNWHPVWIEFW
jgi:hypothetical protein